MATELKKECLKCQRVLSVDRYYTRRDGNKTDMCKECLTMHINVTKPDTFTWILKDMDIPYLPEEWNKLVEKAYANDPKKFNPTSIFGKYLSKMKLGQWKDYTWADSERLIAQNEQKRAEREADRQAYENELKEQFDNGEITEAQYKTMVSTEAQTPLFFNQLAETMLNKDNMYQEDNFLKEEDLIDYTAELTADDKIAMAIKWGRLYKPAEWIELEKNYMEMTNSFDIQDADTIAVLILICKTNLKMNQALDAGDIEGFQKLSKTYNDLRKSAKFTAAQNKEQKNDYVDSVGELVAMCEKEGFIPRYATDIPQDKVDLTLADMKDYLNKLVTQDLGFGQQIEDALKKIQIQKEMNEAEENSDGEIEEFIDEDYENFYNSIEQQKNSDLEMQEEEQ